jgi:hypothetical protein
MEDLKTILGKVEGITEANANERFTEIAKELFCNYEIKKGDKTYDFVELEFYYYSDKHKDIMTYPRNTVAGEWFNHRSGVDITFKSEKKVHAEATSVKDEIAENVFGGGILIKSIQEKGSSEPTGGVFKTWDILFEHMGIINPDELEVPNYFPQIVRKAESKETIDSERRKGVNARRYKEKYARIEGYIAEKLPEPIDEWAENWANKTYRYIKAQ